ncbi:hypothetical protein RHMOL_Rhmol06G0258400 [Rhododendron molle]|uniref:Uncharacterized protein n=1 Tax=Rhododendron molle TaxID=49168 RepID=A0ACC0NG39_RHOML|nr:hypothetical protein RHMOL_Rhmol06G0258400 [Rhododendron molle]
MVMLTMAKGGVASNIPDYKPRYSGGIDGEMKAVSRLLLDLPLEIKLRNSHLVQGKGYTPLNKASPVFEGLGCYDMAAPGNLDNFFDQLCVSDPRQRINKYNYTPEYVGSTGAVLHTDLGFLTILQDDEIIGGLEAVRKDTGEYVPVDPMPGSLVVNLGDLAVVGFIE